MDLTVLEQATVREGAKPSGTQAIVDFPNGYSASVISDGYGADNGLYEVAVMYNGHLDYSTPITSDVLGHLTEQEVIDTCNAIGALEPKSKA